VLPDAFSSSLPCNASPNGRAWFSKSEDEILVLAQHVMKICYKDGTIIFPLGVNYSSVSFLSVVVQLPDAKRWISGCKSLQCKILSNSRRYAYHLQMIR
jgi:hypothetical protein